MYNPLEQSVITLYQASAAAHVLLDGSFRVLWANDAALARYPFLSTPDGMHLLIPSGRTELLTQLRGRQSCHLRGERLPLAAPDLFLEPLFEADELTAILVLIAGEPAHEPSALPQGAERIIGGFSSVYRTPLSVVFSFVQSMLQRLDKAPASPLHEELTAQLRVIAKHCYKMLRSTQNITEITRMMSGTYLWRMGNVNVRSLLQRLCDSAGALFAASHVELTADIDVDDLTAVLDPVGIETAFYNLISNAVLFSPPDNCRIHVSVQQRRDSVYVSVSDHGYGIAPEHLSRVFEPYYSVGTQGQPFAGLGLGLTAVRHIVTAHGGTVAIQSQEGMGTTVAFTLPLREDPSLPVLARQPEHGAYDGDHFARVYIELADVLTEFPLL